MKINDLQNTWDNLAKDDPLWAISTYADKKGNKWDQKEFFLTGKKEIENLMGEVGQLNVDFSRNRAMDFGCGVGRLTQPLSAYFKECIGVDISPTMVNFAKKYNEHQNCKYILNDKADLSIFDDNSIDFIYTSYVLQHMHPDISTKYIKEFLRILTKNGILVFQIPDKPRYVPNALLNIYSRVKFNNMEMYGISKKDIENAVKTDGATLLKVKTSLNQGKIWKYNNCYFIKK